MSKLLSNIVFYGGAVIIGSVGGLIISFTNANKSNSELDVSSILEIEVPSEIGNIEIEPTPESKDEEKPVISNEKSWEKPAEFTSKAVDKPVEPVENNKTTTPQPQVHTFENYNDYEKPELGVCPSEKTYTYPWENGVRLNAIGIIDFGPYKTNPLKSLKSYIETWWNSYRRGTLPNNTYLGKYMMANLTQIEGFENTYSNTLIAMYIEFDGFFVTWDNSWQDGKPMNLTTEQGEYLDKVQSDGTNYLRWLENTYNAKCPND